MNDLTREDAERLFNNVSKAVKDNDQEKLGTLYESPAPDDELEEEQPNPDPQEDIETDTPTPEEDEGEETSPPPKADEADEDEKDEPPVSKELAALKEQLESMKKENHALKSQAGRVPHVQKRLRELDKKLEELQNASPSSQTSAKIKPKLDDLLKDLKETDSVLADTIAKAIEQATNGVDEQLRAREIENITFMREREAREYQTQEAERLVEMYPNVREVFQSPHWSQWKDKQSEGILALATSSNADDVSKALKMYSEDMLALYPDLAKPAVGTPKTEDTEAAAKAKKIEEERSRKKQTAANLASPNAPGKTSMPDDPEALFKKFSEQLRKERTGQ